MYPIAHKIESQIDFFRFCREMGVSVGKMHELKSVPMDLCLDQFPDRVYYGKSDINGVGAFCGERVAADQTINPAFENGQWTMMGRYTNHSGEPNCDVMAVDGIVYFIAKTEIHPLDEFTVDYRKVRECMNKLNLCRKSGV